MLRVAEHVGGPPRSTTSPSRITTTVVAHLGDHREVVGHEHQADAAVRSRSSASRSSTSACTVTSSAVVASSAISSSGSSAIAIADEHPLQHPARQLERVLLAHARRVAQPHLREQLDGPLPRGAAGQPGRTRSTSASWRPTVIDGLR